MWVVDCRTKRTLCVVKPRFKHPFGRVVRQGDGDGGEGVGCGGDGVRCREGDGVVLMGGVVVMTTGRWLSSAGGRNLTGAAPENGRGEEVCGC
nr:hypothetical protein [Tanacetum cinerariifolium]